MTSNRKLLSIEDIIVMLRYMSPSFFIDYCTNNYNNKSVLIQSVQYREAAHRERLFGRTSSRRNELALHANAAASSLLRLSERVELRESNGRCADHHDSLASPEKRLQLQRLLDSIVSIVGWIERSYFDLLDHAELFTERCEIENLFYSFYKEDVRFVEKFSERFVPGF